MVGSNPLLNSKPSIVVRTGNCTLTEVALGRVVKLQGTCLPQLRPYASSPMGQYSPSGPNERSFRVDPYTPFVGWTAAGPQSRAEYSDTEEAKKRKGPGNLSKIRNGIPALKTLGMGAHTILNPYQTLNPPIAAHFNLPS